MSKKRVNFGSIATSEAARRELMKPVTCWEKAWVTPEGSKVRVRQWVRTTENPEWSDEEADNIDQPLAPILDVEVVDMEEDEEGVEAGDTAEATTTPADGVPAPDGGTEPPSESLDVLPEATHPELSLLTPDDPADESEPVNELTLDPTLDTADTRDLTADLDVPELTVPGLTEEDLGGDLTVGIDLASGDGLIVGDDLAVGGDLVDVGELAVGGDMDFTLSGDPMDMLPPDGTAFEAVHDLSQMEQGDDLLGGKVMEESGDPFVNVS